MNRRFITTAGVMAVTVVVTACAGPETGNRVVLPLDHGPRAQTTPWSNQQRLLRAEQEARAKAEAQSAPKPDAVK